jgi:hypothetical protein
LGQEVLNLIFGAENNSKIDIYKYSTYFGFSKRYVKTAKRCKSVYEVGPIFVMNKSNI